MSQQKSTRGHSFVVQFGEDERLSPLQKASGQVYTEEKTGKTWVAPPVSFAELKRLYDPYHSRCLLLKAMCSVGFGWENDNGGELLLPGNNHGETAQDVLNECADDFEGTGNAYLELVRNAGGRIGELYWLPSAQTQISKDRTQVQQDAGGGKKTEWPLWNGAWPTGAERCVLHIARAGTWSSWYGEPDWLGAIDSLMLAGSARLYMRKMLDNNCIPPFMVTLIGAGIDDIPGVGSDGQKLPSPLEEFVDGFEKNFRGAQNAGKAAFQSLPDEKAKIQVDRLGANFGDTKDLITILNTCRDEAVTMHGVPPRLVGIITSGQLGGGSEIAGQLRLFQSTVVAERHRIWEAALNQVLPMMEGVTAGARIRFRGMDLEGLDDSNPASVSDVLARVDRMVKRAGGIRG